MSTGEMLSCMLGCTLPWSFVDLLRRAMSMPASCEVRIFTISECVPMSLISAIGSARGFCLDWISI